MQTYGAFEIIGFTKSRAFADTTWTSISEAVSFFQDRGAVAERDEDHPGYADVFTADWRVLTVEAL